MKAPAITVLMPAYNAAPYIEEAIRSVLQQSFNDFELLIINDGSTDESASIIRSFSDPRIRLVDMGNSGVARALNTGLQHAKASLVARMDADDICLPQRLELQHQFMESHPGFLVCGAEAEYISGNGHHLFHFKSPAYEHEEIVSKIITHCPFIHTTVMYQKDAILQAGGYPEAAHSFEDHLLWIRIMNAGKFMNLPRQLVKVRLNPSSVTIDEKWRGRHFLRIKKQILQTGTVTPAQEAALVNILRKQDNKKFKTAAYHALCGKKFLLNNHQPAMARKHIIKSIRLYPGRLSLYAWYVLSWLPRNFINWLKQKSG